MDSARTWQAGDHDTTVAPLTSAPCVATCTSVLCPWVQWIWMLESQPRVGFVLAYERVRDTIQKAGDALIACDFGRHDRRAELLVAATAALIGQVDLMIKHGAPIGADLIDLWDDTKNADLPFVLVYLRGLPNQVGARQPDAHRGGEEHKP